MGRLGLCVFYNKLACEQNKFFPSFLFQSMYKSLDEQHKKFELSKCSSFWEKYKFTWKFAKNGASKWDICFWGAKISDKLLIQSEDFYGKLCVDSIGNTWTIRTLKIDFVERLIKWWPKSEKFCNAPDKNFNRLYITADDVTNMHMTSLTFVYLGLHDCVT